MHKLSVLLYISLMGIFLLSACTGPNGSAQGQNLESPSPASEKSPELSTPMLKATSTTVVIITQTPVKPTTTARATTTPTVTETLKVVDAAARIDLLLMNLAKDLDSTETIQETEIP